MIKNTLKFSLRIFKREKLFTSINIAGLVLGYTTCVFVLGYVLFEFSYESEISNSSSIYRVNTKRYLNEKKVYHAGKGPSRLGEVAVEKIPNLEAAVRVYNEICLVYTDEYKSATEKVSWVGKDFFKVFKGVLLIGDPETVLDGPLKTVLTASKANALFGKENPIGKTVKINEGMVFQVSGVVKDPPENTHFKYDYLTTLSTFVKYGWMSPKGNWNRNFNYTYVTIGNSASKEKVGNDLNALALLHVDPKKEKGQRLEFELDPIQSIHLNSHFADDFELNGNVSLLYIVITVGVLLLLIVFLNFVNLSTALVLKRTKDVGVRKTFGASKMELRAQYFVEALLLNFVAFVLAALLVLISKSYLEQLFQIHFSFKFLSNPISWLLLLVFFLGTIVLVAMYPALVLSSLNIVSAVKGKLNHANHTDSTVKKVLLTVQFTASIFLIIGAFVIYQQVNYMKNHDLGMDMKHVLSLQAPSTLNSGFRNKQARAIKERKFRYFKERLLKNSGIKNVGTSMVLPGQDVNRRVINKVQRMDTGEVFEGKMERRIIDESFFPVYGTGFLAGKNFLPSPVDKPRQDVIINDKARKLLGFKSASEAIGKMIHTYNPKLKIVGVVKDIHLKSLDESVEPTFFVNVHPWEFGYYLIKLDGVHVSEQINFIKSIWEDNYPNDPFVPEFSDHYFNQQYKSYEQFGIIFNALTLLTIFIANLGLLAMVSLSTTEKLKEIGVRRVLGASNKEVFKLMSIGFMRLILISGAIASPMVWYFLQNWLNNFSYKIVISPVYFLIGICSVILVALLNISFYAYKALRYHPVEIIREE